MDNPFAQFGPSTTEPPAPPAPPAPTDDSADTANPFAQFGPSSGASNPQASAPPAPPDNPFAQFGPSHSAPEPDETSSAAGAFARGAVKSAPAVVGGLAGAGAMAAAGASIGSAAGPVGTVVGGLAGGLLGAYDGSYLISGVRDWVLNKMGLEDNGGFFSKQQEQADLQQHPYWHFAGQMGANLVAMSPTEGANLAKRTMGGLIMGGMEAGQEATHGELDPEKIAMAAGTGFIAPEPRKWARGVMEAGTELANVGRPDQVPTEPQAAQPEAGATPEVGTPAAKTPEQMAADKKSVQKNDLTMTAAGTSQENTPVSEPGNIGNEVNPPTRDRGNSGKYAKKNRGKAVTEPVTQQATVQTQPSQPLTTDTVQPDVQAALTAAQPEPTNTPAQTPTAAQSAAPAATDVLAKAPSAVYEHPELPGVTIDRRPAVSTLTGSNGNTVYIDNKTPASISVEGKALDPALPLAVREQATQAAKQAFSEHPSAARVPLVQQIATANKLGEQAEDKWLTDHGYNPEAYRQTVDALRLGAGAPGGPPVPVAGNNSVYGGVPARGNGGTDFLPGPVPRVATPPKVVDAARQALTEAGYTKALEKLNGAPPEQQPVMARQILTQLQGKTPAKTYAEARMPTENPTVEGLPVKARNAALAAKKGQAFKSMQDTFTKFPPSNDVTPVKPADLAAFQQRMRDAVKFATDENGGQNPIDSYNMSRSRGKAIPPEYRWLKAATKLANADRVTPRQAAEFIANEKLYRSGNPEDANIAAQTGRINADIEKSQAPTAEEAAAAQAQPFPGEPVTPEETEAAPVPASTAADISKLDFANMSDKDLEDLAAQQRGTGEQPEAPAWKAAEEERAVKMAQQKAARLAAQARNMLTDESGGGPAPQSGPKSKAYQDFENVLNTKAKPSLVRKIVSPASVSKLSEAAAAMIREVNGVGARGLHTVVDKLEPFRKQINALPEQARDDFMMAIDEGSQVPAPLRAAASVFKEAFANMRKQLEALPQTADKEFLENYFPHMFKNRMKGAEFVANWLKQGNSSSLKSREFPTLRDALAAGLELETHDPVEVLMRYLGSMQQFSNRMKMLQQGVDEGIVKSFDKKSVGASGHASASLIPEDYVKLGGAGFGDGRALYAPSDWAHVYNNYISAGVHASENWGHLYDHMLRMSNAWTSVQLGVSLYHLGTMVEEAIVNQAQIGLSKVLGGNLGGLKDIATAPGAFYSLFKIGRGAQDMYLNRVTNGTPELRNMVDLATRAGGRLVGRSHDPTFQYSGMGSLATSLRRGAFNKEIGEMLGRIKDAEDFPSKAGTTAMEAAGMVGRVLQTVAQPLFETYIPALKAGAYMQNLRAYLEAHPDATNAQQLHMARVIGDSVDNRFGEMVHDNIFWNKGFKQVAQFLLRSYSWNVGTIREIGGGLASFITDPRRVVMSSEHYDPRAAYALTLPIVVGLINTAYQYLKTGKMPSSAMDVAAPRTGGVATSVGAPERAELPGYQKDVYQWSHDPWDELGNKIGAFPRLLYDLAMNEDYRGLPVRNPEASAGEQGEQMGMYALKSLEPISVEQMKKQVGSNISYPERGLAIRAAPTWMEAPGYIGAMDQKRNIRNWKAKIRADAKDQALNR